MTFTSMLQHLFNPFKGTNFVPGTSGDFPSIFAVFPGISAVFLGISAFIPGIFAPGVFNFGLVLLRMCSFRTRNLQTQRHIYDMMVAKFPGGGGNLNAAILCFLCGRTVPVRNAKCKP